MKSNLAILLVLLLLSAVANSGCQYQSQEAISPEAEAPPVTAIPQEEEYVAGSAEVPVLLIPLVEPLNDPNVEISAMDWYGDNLVLVPQYPRRYGDQLFAVAKADIMAFMDASDGEPLQASPIPINSAELAAKIPGFEGFEAAAFVGDQLFLTVEASPRGMIGYLVQGIIEPDLSGITVDVDSLVEIDPQADLSNMTDETLLATDDGFLTLYEAYGLNVNPEPVAQRFDANGRPQSSISMVNIDYRITDATRVDSAGRFWAINYFWPGDTKLKPLDPEPLAATYGAGATHRRYPQVERLVQFQLTPDGIELVDTAPIQLELLDADTARNWEGIVRLESDDDSLGFLLATDKFPETLLGFVAYP